MRLFERAFVISAAATALGCAASGEQRGSTDSAKPIPTAEKGSAGVADSQPRSQGTGTVQVFFIALEGATEAEKIGCGDAMLPVTVDAQGTKAPLRFALEELLSGNTKPGGAKAYNALSKMNLRIDSITMHVDTAIIGLSGQFTYGGVCDAPRIDAQLSRTATQFATVPVARFFVNGRALSQLLSER